MMIIIHINSSTCHPFVFDVSFSKEYFALRSLFGCCRYDMVRNFTTLADLLAVVLMLSQF